MTLVACRRWDKDQAGSSCPIASYLIAFAGLVSFSIIALEARNINQRPF